MRIHYEWMGVEALARALKRKSETDFKKVEQKNILNCGIGLFGRRIRLRVELQKTPVNCG